MPTTSELSTSPSQAPGITIGFVGTADAALAPLARRYEDEVLALLADHGARLVFRGHRQADQPDTLPAEFHVIWFPDEMSLDNYRADPRRAALIDRHGPVFTSTTAVRLDPIG